MTSRIKIHNEREKKMNKKIEAYCEKCHKYHYIPEDSCGWIPSNPKNYPITCEECEKKDE
jgi:hypothetical protein